MNTKTLGKIFLASCMYIAFMVHLSARDTKPDVVPLGNDTYSIKCEAKNAFDRDTDRLKAKASDAADKFCAENGKQIKVISLTSKVPTFSLGYAWAKIVFKALNPGDPELTRTAAPENAAPGNVTAAPPAERTISTDELYSELTKLDDLRKKGILTDEEFQAEKKKVLSHSK